MYKFSSGFNPLHAARRESVLYIIYGPCKGGGEKNFWIGENLSSATRVYLLFFHVRKLRYDSGEFLRWRVFYERSDLHARLL